MNEMYARGMNTFRRIEPKAARAVETSLAELFPDFARLTVEFGYGEIMSREGLDLRTRELVNVAVLGAMGTAPEQLKMHVEGAFNVGVTTKELFEIVLQLAGYAGFPAGFNVLRAVKAVLDEHGEAGQP